MRHASGALIALLNSATEFVTADLVTIIQVDGTITRLTNASADLTAVSQYDNASHTFSAGLPFTRGQTKLVRGTQVDTLGLTLFPGAANTLGGQLWPAAVRSGALDNADLLLEKLIMPNWTDASAGTLILFWGRLASPTFTRTSIQLQVKSDLQLLQAQMPRNIYQTGCLHTLFDSGCTLSKAAFATAGAVGGGGPTTTQFFTTLGAAVSYYDNGAITFTSGANVGKTAIVRTYGFGGFITLVVGLPVAPAPGDTFTIVPACDKTSATCTTKFANLVHFRGFANIPVPEAAR